MKNSLRNVLLATAMMGGMPSTTFSEPVRYEPKPAGSAPYKPQIRHNLQYSGLRKINKFNQRKRRKAIRSNPSLLRNKSYKKHCK